MARLLVIEDQKKLLQSLCRGLEEEGHLPHVFERFYRVDPARGREAEGFGLGLSICRSIAEAHGGEIRAEGAIGRGTRAILSVPATSAEDASVRVSDSKTAEREGRSRVPT